MIVVGECGGSIGVIVPGLLSMLAWMYGQSFDNGALRRRGRCHVLPQIAKDPIHRATSLRQPASDAGLSRFGAGMARR
jgi:hypothetical protein